MDDFDKFVDGLLDEVMDGVAECTGCGADIELDCEACGNCGKPSKYIAMGVI